jgi:lipopolysaccharide/colanic/teichoic acid biosynthesis glycosyltransferase
MARSQIIKRAIDIVGATAGLLILAPLLMVVAVAIRVTMGRPVLFSQIRPGYRAQLFTMLKFRTMREACGADGQPLPDVARLTRLGSLLRRTSVDELPQLWNVLRGDMSLVGPRPLFAAYLDRYTATQARRHEVRPGLTGLAQINGRQDILFSRRLELDVWYVDHWSLGLDANILLLTVIRVLRARGVRGGQDDVDLVDLGPQEPVFPSSTDVTASALIHDEGGAYAGRSSDPG